MPFDQLHRRDFITLLGGAGAWPLAARAQQVGKRYTIGLFSAGIAPENAQNIAFWAPFFDALRELGWAEGKNVAFERRYGENRIERLPVLAAELVRLNVDVIVTIGTLAPLAAKRATSTIPIVMTSAGDPLGSGLVASLARPGGNVTGMSLMAPELGGKRLELLKEVLPGSRAWRCSGMRPIRMPRLSSRRRRPQAGHWGSRFNPWRCEARMTSMAHSKRRDGNTPMP